MGVPVHDLVQTCFACPSQWEFRTFEDRPVYVKCRWGRLQICIGRPGRSAADAVWGPYIFCDKIGAEGDGYIEWKWIAHILDWVPRARADRAAAAADEMREA